MESATFRKWLVEHGCRFDRHEHEKRGEGQVIVTVHREGRKAEVPLGGSHQILDARVVRQACEELGLDWSQLPGPAGRVWGNEVPLSLNVRQSFTVDLRVLGGKISEIGSLTDKQITEAIEALVKHDVTLASHFAAAEDRGNAL